MPVAGAFVQERVRLRRIVVGMGFGAADADDILQDVFVEARTRPGRCRGENEARRWLTRVTVNRCLGEYRRRKRFRCAAERIVRRQAQASPDTADAGAIRAEEVAAVQDAMRELDGPLLAPLVLRYFSGLNATEIADALELNANTVRSRLRKARLILAEKLIERGISE